MFYKLQYRNWTLGRPKSYIKGPDVMSKSLRTQQRYASAFKDQTRLDTFIGTHSSIPQIQRVSDCSMSSMESGESVEIIYSTHTVSADEEQCDRVSISDWQGYTKPTGFPGKGIPGKGRVDSSVTRLKPLPGRRVLADIS